MYYVFLTGFYQKPASPELGHGSNGQSCGVLMLVRIRQSPAEWMAPPEHHFFNGWCHSLVCHSIAALVCLILCLNSNSPSYHFPFLSSSQIRLNYRFPFLSWIRSSSHFPSLVQIRCRFPSQSLSFRNFHSPFPTRRCPCLHRTPLPFHRQSRRFLPPELGSWTAQHLVGLPPARRS